MDYTNYPEIELWEKPMPHRNGINYREQMTSTGGVTFDVEKFIHSEIGYLKLQDVKHFINHPDEDDPEVYDYWKELGATRRIETDPNTGVRWISYVPDGLTGPAPMIIDICQGPYNVETFGLIQFAVKQGILFASPYTHTLSDVLVTVDAMKRQYPVDESRVYIAGFSYGGIMATWLGYAAPKVFAAVNCMGTIEPIFYPGEIEAMDPTERRRRAFGDEHAAARMAHVLDDALMAGRYKMPVIINTGTTELRSTLPLTLTPDVPLGGWRAICKERGFNMMMRVIGHREFFYDEFEQAARGGSPTERAIGVFFDRTEERVISGVRHYIGDELVDGEALLRYIAIENLPHEPSPLSPPLLWEFLRKFRRDTKTGELIIEK